MRAPHRGVHNTTLGRPSARHRREQGSDKVRSPVAVRKGATEGRANVGMECRPFLLPWHGPATRGECPTRKNTNPVTARPQRPTTRN